MNRLIPSNEQQDIINCVINKQHVISSAVAGSGKSTLVLALAQSTSKKILQLTYNKLLKMEVETKAKKYGIDTIEIHTYHSLGVKYYNKEAHDDITLNEIIEEHTNAKIELPEFDIIVVDEAQDMSRLYYKFVRKVIQDIIKNNTRTITLLILGDRYQEMYKFKGADHRYLSFADIIWSEYIFEKKSLSTSYRVTKSIAWFINNAMLGNNRIISHKDGYPVYYLHHDMNYAHDIILPEIIKMLESGEIKVDDIFVLAYSIKGPFAPIKKLENEFIKYRKYYPELNIECYMPSSDESKIDDNVIKNKIVFSTFHQAKGRERKVVIVYGFDNSYYEYYDKEAKEDECPQNLYVACTRASLRLFLIESIDKKPLPFLKLSKEELQKSKFIDYHEDKDKKNTRNPKQFTFHKTSPTDLVKFIKQENLTIINKLVKQLFTTVREKGKIIEIPLVIETSSGNYEQISELNGLIIPAILEAKQHGITSLHKEIDIEIKNGLYNKHPFFKSYVQKIKKENLKLIDYVYLGLVYISVKNRIYHKLVQIDNLNWLTYDIVQKCHNNMNIFVSNKIKYELELPINSKHEENYVKINKYIKEVIFKKENVLGCDVEFNGIIDGFDKDIIWEFKCVEELTIEHYLQVILYAWLWKVVMVEKYGSRRFLLMNIRSEEIQELDTNSNLIDDIIKILLENKYCNEKEIDDETFIQLNKN